MTSRVITNMLMFALSLPLLLMSCQKQDAASIALDQFFKRESISYSASTATRKSDAGGYISFTDKDKKYLALVSPLGRIVAFHDEQSSKVLTKRAKTTRRKLATDEQIWQRGEQVVKALQFGGKWKRDKKSLLFTQGHGEPTIPDLDAFVHLQFETAEHLPNGQTKAIVVMLDALEGRLLGVMHISNLR